MRLSWLGTPLFLALPPELCGALVQDTAGRNMACEKKTFCSQGLEHCSVERARPLSSIVPIWSLSSIMHLGQTGHLLGDTCKQ